MYQPHLQFKTPADDTKLWRYMNLSQFMWMLFSGSLYFSTLRELQDPWEGTWASAFFSHLEKSRHIASLKKLGHSVSRAKQNMINEIRSEEGRYGVSCWHRNEVESIAMWKLYTDGKDGVAIQTTIDRLKSSVAGDPRYIYIGDVEYTDQPELHHPGKEVITIRPMLLKGTSYSHEREVRVFLNRFLDLAGYEESRRSPSHLKGEALKIELSTLIQQVIVAPFGGNLRFALRFLCHWCVSLQ